MVLDAVNLSLLSFSDTMDNAKCRSPRVTVSQESARLIAENYLKNLLPKLGLSSRTGQLETRIIGLEIDFPNYLFSETMLSGRGLARGKTRAVFKFSFRQPAAEGDIGWTSTQLWVDVETGRIIGGVR